MQILEVEVRGDTFYSREVRKVMIRVYQPMTFVQTDKPIYLPGQTGNSELIIYDVEHNIVLYGFPLHKPLKMCVYNLFMDFFKILKAKQ